MLYQIVYIIIFFNQIVFSAVNNCTYVSCNSHTQIYTDIHNDMTSTLFLENTYLPNYGIDPCMVYKSRTEYIKLLNSYNIECSGKWCVDNDFSCKNTGDEC